jgi:hypothetical protein
LVWDQEALGSTPRFPTADVRWGSERSISRGTLTGALVCGRSSRRLATAAVPKTALAHKAV